jgi:protein-disulfide isomerase
MSNSKNLIPILFATAVLVVGGVLVYRSNPNLFQETEQTKIAPLPGDEKRENSLGSPEAKVVIVEYSDFQCPFCQKFHPIVKQIVSEYPDQVRWVYKHFPLDRIHQQARPAAEASECAAEQGKFWEFAQGLFENQASLGKELYFQLAEDLGLSKEQFESCFSSRKYKDKVEADYQEGIKLGVRGTPTSLISGEQLLGYKPYQTLKEAVERALK